MFKDPVAAQTFKMAVNFANINPNSVNAEFNRTNSQSNARVALSGAASLSAMIINYHKKPQDAKRDLKEQFDTEASKNAAQKESEAIQVCERFLNLTSPRSDKAKKGKKGKKGAKKQTTAKPFEDADDYSSRSS